MSVAALMFVAQLASSSAPGCDWIELGDEPNRSIEELTYVATPEQIEVLLNRTIDRLESRACLARASEVLELLDRRLAELERSGAQVTTLRARVELVGVRVELRRSCSQLVCGRPLDECATLDTLGEFVHRHPELDLGSVEAWFVAGQDDAEALRCVLARAMDPQPGPQVHDQPGPERPPERPANTIPVDELGVDKPGWNPTSRRAVIGLNAVGVALGVAAMVTGGVFLTLDERCPGGLAPDQCEFRYSTREEGIVALSLGSAALIGSTVGLTFSVLRRPSPATPGSTGSTSWLVGAGWSARF
jgi:hypothetical protein